MNQAEERIETIIYRNFDEHLNVINSVLKACKSEISLTAKLIVDALKGGNKILFMGNGGSAADSQHLAAELVGRYKTDRPGLPSIALTTDTSIITAVGNDFGYETIFERQIKALANSGDVVCGISTSGNSINIIKALDAAKTLGCKTIGLTGKDGGKMKSACDITIAVPSEDTARIQETHILIGHSLCEIVDSNFSTRQ